MSMDSPTKEIGAGIDEADRKLWFDFLAKLNDRSLQEKRESGATSWVLLAAAVAILYKAVPQIPHFLSVPGAIGAAGTIFLLETDAGCFLSLAFSSLQMYATGGGEKRLLTDITKRAGRIIMIVTWVAMTALGAAHIRLWERFVGPRLVRWVLLAFAIYWFLNTAFGVIRRYWKASIAKRRRTTVPEFGFEFGHNIGALALSAICLIFSLLALLALYVLISALNRDSRDWITPLSAAGFSFAMLAVVLILFGRAISSGYRKAYLTLERAIVVENLSPKEIRLRFEKNLLGTAVADWLKDLTERVNQEYASLRLEFSQARDRAKEIEEIDSQYPLERIGRAQKLMNEHRKAVAGHFAKIKGYLFQLKESTNVPTSNEEDSILKRILADWDGLLKQVEAESSETAAALESLRAGTEVPATDKSSASGG